MTGYGTRCFYCAERLVGGECPTCAAYLQDDPTPTKRRINNKATRASGERGIQEVWTRDAILGEMQRMANALDRTPRLRDFDDTPRCPSTATVIRKFGSWRAAVEAAGLDPNHRRANGDDYDILCVEAATLKSIGWSHRQIAKRQGIAHGGMASRVEHGEKLLAAATTTNPSKGRAEG